MAYTANTVNASFTDIAKSFENITGVASTFKVEVAEAAALLQSLAKTGVRGPKAGTYVRNYLDDLLGAPISQRAEKTLNSMGMQRYDPTMYGEGDFGAAQYSDTLVAKLAEKPFVEQQDAIRSISNARSRRVLRQELAEYAKQTKDANGELERTNTLYARTVKLSAEAEGSLARMAQALSGDTKYQFVMAQAAYNAATVDAFSAGEEALTRTAQTLKEIFNSKEFESLIKGSVSAFSTFIEYTVAGIKATIEFSSSLKGLGDLIGSGIKWTAIAAGTYAIAAGLAALSTVTFTVAAATGAAAAAMRVFTAAITANPIGAAVVAIMALGMAYDQWADRNAKVAESMNTPAAKLQLLIDRENELTKRIESRGKGRGFYGTEDQVDLGKLEAELAAVRQTIKEHQKLVSEDIEQKF
jgi:TP901 family phage tail tape measure protein